MRKLIYIFYLLISTSLVSQTSENKKDSWFPISEKISYCNYKPIDTNSFKKNNLILLAESKSCDFKLLKFDTINFNEGSNKMNGLINPEYLKYFIKLLNDRHEITLCIKPFEKMETTQNISVYLKDNYSKADLNRFKEKLGNKTFVSIVKFISKEAAMKNLISSGDLDYEILGDINPLPNSLVLELNKNKNMSQDELKEFKSGLLKNKMVSEVIIPNDYFLNTINDFCVILKIFKNY